MLTSGVSKQEATKFVSMMVKKSPADKKSKFGHYSKKRQKNHCFKKEYFKKRASLLFLQRAIENYYTNSISRFLQTGMDVNAAPKFPEPLLHTAVRNAKYKVVQQLIDAGANVNFIGRSMDNLCCHPPQFLVPNPKIQCPGAPLIIAVEKGKEKMVKLLLQNKADPNISSCRGLALNIAVEKGIFKIVKLLLRAGADINAGTNDYKPLHTAISKNNYIMIKYLIKWKADVNALGRYIHDRNSGLYLPLQIAILKENIKVMRLLINNKAKIDETGCDGAKILHFSLTTNNPEVVSFCVINTADLNAVSYRKESALHIACQKQNIINVLNIILEAGVDINLKDHKGLTALERCYDYYGHMLEALKQHIVKLKAAEMYLSEDILRQFNEVKKAGYFGLPMEMNDYDNDSFDYDSFYKRCITELEVMKTINITNTNVNFYQILHKHQHKLALLLMYVAYEDYYSEDNLRLKFPLYGGMIFYRLTRAFNEKKSLVVINKTLNKIFERELPDLIKRCIYEYFNYTELIMLSKV